MEIVMSSRKTFSRSLAAIAISIALPAFAAEAQRPSTDAACNKARKDLAFMEQLAMSDGTNPYTNAPAPEACKAAEKLAKENAAKESKPSSATAGNSAAASRTY
jgi:hypothetical protein